MTILLSPTERRAIKRTMSLLDLDRGRVALSILTGAAGLTSAVALSGVAAWLIARASQMPDVVALGVAPVLVRLFGVSRSILRYCERLISHDTALRGMNALRTRVYEILSLSRADVIAGLRRGDVLARVGADVDAVGDLVVRGLLPVGVAAVVGLATSLVIGIVYWPAGIILLICLLLAGVLGPLSTIRAARMAEQARQQQNTELTSLVFTAIDGGSELSVSERMGALQSSLTQTETELAQTRNRGARPAALAASIDTLAMGLAVLGSILVGLPAVEAGVLGPVWLAVIVLVPLAAFEATAALGPASVQLVTSAGAAVRITGLLDAAEAAEAAHQESISGPKPSGDGPVSEPVATTVTPRLTASGLAAGWPGSPLIVENIDLSLEPGRKVAIIGPSGIGKTTLLLTLAGMLEPRGGTVILNRHAPWERPRSEVAALLSLTQEDAHIFDTSVLENLRVARGDLSSEEAVELLEQAGLGSWLSTLPQGLDTIVGSDAALLSGGERRRLLLARALAAPAPLMLLDEPAEHLDPDTADQLVSDLLNADSERGVLLVTHRLSALESADEVLILAPGEDGGPARVRRRGTHAQLLAQDAEYRWALAQEEPEHG